MKHEKRTTYRKLVRDNIPNIIRKNGATPVVRTLGTEAFRQELREKLCEEADEVRKATGRQALIDELADVEEVFSALCEAHGVDRSELAAVRKRRARLNGAFTKKLFLVEVKKS